MAERTPERDEDSRPPVMRRVTVREFRRRVRSLAVGTATAVAVVLAYLVFAGVFLDASERTTVGVVGQATALAEPLRTSAGALGVDVTVTPYRDVAQARHEVADGTLDVLVSGSTSSPRLLSATPVDPLVRAALTDVSRAVVLDAKLAEAGLDPAEVREELDSTRIDVATMDPGADDRRDPTPAVALSCAVFAAIAVHGTHAARRAGRGACSESAAPARRVALGVLTGVGLAGAAQFAVVGAVTVVTTLATGVPPALGTAVESPLWALSRALLWGVLWYALGFAVYATTATALRLRSGARPRTATAMSLLLAAFAVGVALLGQPGGPMSATLSVLPLLSAVVLPGRIGMDLATTAELTVGVALAVSTAAVATWVLRSGWSPPRSAPPAAALDDGADPPS